MVAKGIPASHQSHPDGFAQVVTLSHNDRRRMHTKFRYTRRNPVLTGRAFTVWTSGDLRNWTQDAAATQLPGPMVNAIETVEVTLTAPPVNGRLFVRVQAAD